MRRFLIPTILVLVLAAAAFAGTSGRVTWPDGLLGVLGKDLNEIRQRHIITPVYEVTASDTTTIPVTHSFVHILPSTGNAACLLSFATTGAVEGQHVYLFNGSATATSGLATITAAVGTGHLMFASGSWRLVSDE